MSSSDTNTASSPRFQGLSNTLRVLGVSWVVWTAIALVGVGQVSVSRTFAGGEARVGRGLPLGAIGACYFWWLMTPVVFAISRRFPFASGRRARAIVVHGASALSLAVFPSLLAIWLIGIRPERFAVQYRGLLNLRYSLDVVIYFAIVSVAAAVELFKRSQAQALAESRLAAELAQARLDALTAQLHPHFLFNALNGVAMLIRRQAYAPALRAVVGYGELLQAVLRRDGGDVALRDELVFVRRYLEIEQMRFPNALAVSVNAEAEAEATALPHLLLQPIVENALRHGLAKMSRDARVSVVATRVEDRVRIEVRDNGTGFPEGWSAANSRGIGLRNVRARLSSRFGAAPRLDIQPAPDGGTIVAIDIPFERAAG